MSVFKWLKVSRYMKYCMAIGLLGSMTLQAMAQYTGKVFVDENRNGLLDEGEKRLHRVSVSDGLNVVQTDSNGAYQLPGHSRMHFLFITTPSGYKTDNAYYYRIENGRTEYDFPVYPCYEEFKLTVVTGLYISLIQKYVEKKGIKRGWIISVTIRPMRK